MSTELIQRFVSSERTAIRSYCGCQIPFVIAIALCIILGESAQSQSIDDSIRYANTLSHLLPSIQDQTVKEKFQGYWLGNVLTPAQRHLLAELVEKTVDHPTHQNDLATIVVSAKDNANIGPAKLNQLIEICRYVSADYTPAATGKIYDQLKNFLLHNALYYSSYNQLVFFGGTYDFDYVKPNQFQPAEEEPVVAEPEMVQEPDEAPGFSTDQSTEEDSWVVDDDGFEVSYDDFEETDFHQEVVTTPVRTGPIIKFENIQLVFKTPSDSTVLAGSNGSFLLTEDAYEGRGGKMDWTRLGLPDDSVFCYLSEYSFNVKRPQLQAANSQLTFVGTIKNSAQGTFRYANRSDYPRFISDDNDHSFQLDNPNVQLTGGISLTGNRLSTECSSGALATLEGTGSKSANFVAKSRNFILEDTLLYSSGTSTITIWNGLDSIFHPGMRLSFYLNPSLLRLTEGVQSNFKRTPFTTSWFDMDVYTSLINWDLTADSLDISILNAKNVLPVTFESHDYFNEAKFNSLSGLNDFNPLVSAMGYSRQVNSLEFTSLELAQSIGRDPEIMKASIISLSYEGYFDYDPETDLLHITRKGAHNYLSQRRRRDYDFLSITSVIADKPNATLRFKTNEMRIRGVDRIFISRTRDVFIEPDSAEITLMADRNFLFNGSVTAGNFQYIGKGFLFEYDSFLLHLPKVESIKLQENSAERGGEKHGLNNQVIESGGTLYINKPGNKSGLKEYPEYPIYTASSGAIFYFNNPEILDGAYDRTVYFTVPPFTLDSVSNSDAGTVSFEGTFHSGGIFPDFEEKVTVMPDNSLGFIHTIPADGYPLYGQQGRLYNQITMDNSGLRSAGTIEFNTATLKSDDFTFYLDSVAGVGTEIKIAEVSSPEQEYPEVLGSDYKMTWFPDKDRMQISNTGDPFRLFRETATLDGTVTVSSSGATGSGALLTRGSKTVSDQMTLKSDRATALDSRFEIDSQVQGKPHLIAQPVSLDFRLSEDIALLELEEEGVAAIELPFTQLRTSITDVKWDLKARKVFLEKAPELEIDQSFVLLTRPELDSLAFQASGGVYNMEDRSLDISGIPFIKVADAQIVPNGHKFKIFEGAKLPKLVGADLIIDTLSRHHHLYEGDLEIISRRSFTGTAIYRYSNSNGQEFGMRMSEFDLITNPEESPSNRHSTSKGVVTEADQLMISPGVIFRGKVVMNATRRSLVWDGLIKLDLSGAGGETWIRYNNEERLENVAIPFDQSQTEAGKSLTAGIFVDDDGEVYGSFLTPKRSGRDHALFVPTGQLFYDQKRNMYIIEQPSSGSGESFSTNRFAFDDRNSKIEFEGRHSFFPESEAYQLDVAGEGSGDLNQNTYQLGALLTLDFDLPAQVVNRMTDAVQQQIEQTGKKGAGKVQLSRIAQISGPNAAQSYQKRLSSGPVSLSTVAPELNRTFVFSNIDLQWSGNSRAFYANGDLDLSNINRTDVKAQVKGFIEIYPGKTRKVSLFLQFSDDLWFYFGLTRDKGEAVSSDPEYNEAVMSKTKSEKSGSVSLQLVDIEKAQEFVNNYSRDYLKTSDVKTLSLRAASE